MILSLLVSILYVQIFQLELVFIGLCAWLVGWLVSWLQATETTAITSKMDVSESLLGSSYCVTEPRKSDTGRRKPMGLLEVWAAMTVSPGTVY